MREALLYERVTADGGVRCNVCQWRCRISPGHLGRCKVRRNENGQLSELGYGQVSAAHVDPIEKKPLFHFFPGTAVFSLGGWGCNFRCRHCQNWEIAYAEPGSSGSAWTVAGVHTAGQLLMPNRAVSLALQKNCAGICWTYNEPTVWFEYTLECARLAKDQGLYTAYVTNGFLTEEALDLLGPHLDAFRVDVKGFSDVLYQRLAKVAHWRDILAVTERARQRWKMHVEVVTNVIPTLNDDQEQLAGIAEWIVDKLGAEVPWHVTAYHPDAQLVDVPPTSGQVLRGAREIGFRAGLRFVYAGNMPGIGGEDTFCPKCGSLAIKRRGYRTVVMGVLSGGRCSQCGEDLYIRGR